ncbi:MAG TPA: hypothetical protein VIS73_11320 [Rhodocyclaceae bacterium]
MKAWRTLLLTLAIGAIAGAAAAETLRDPTRPAFDIDAGKGVASARPGLPAGDPPATSYVAPRGPRLQSILTRSDGRSLAVIDGKTLAVGDRFGSRRLIAIDIASVTLRGPEGRRVLHLTPAATKTNSRTELRKQQSPAGAQPGRNYP